MGKSNSVLLGKSIGSAGNITTATSHGQTTFRQKKERNENFDVANRRFAKINARNQLITKLNQLQIMPEFAYGKTLHPVLNSKQSYVKFFTESVLFNYEKLITLPDYQASEKNISDMLLSQSYNSISNNMLSIFGYTPPYTKSGLRAFRFNVAPLNNYIAKRLNPLNIYFNTLTNWLYISATLFMTGDSASFVRNGVAYTQPLNIVNSQYNFYPNFDPTPANKKFAFFWFFLIVSATTYPQLKENLYIPIFIGT